MFIKNSKSPIFSPFLIHFPNLGGKKYFSGEYTHNFVWVSKFWKLMTEFPENVWTEGQMEGVTTATVRGPIC